MVISPSSEHSTTLITVGGLFLLGVLTDLVARRTKVPRVTLLLVLGVVIGPVGVDLLPAQSAQWFPLAAHLALTLVGFLLGEQFDWRSVKRSGPYVLKASLTVTLVTALLVALGLVLAKVPLAEALLLGSIATATAPAATLDVVRESRARGHFVDILRGIVAIDDVWGLCLFSVTLAIAGLLLEDAQGVQALLDGVRELGGALLLGGALGFPAAYVTGRLHPGEPTLVEALGVSLLCGGLALWLDVSFLLASVTLGAMVANFAKHHQRPFHAIEHVEWPFMILFFVLAGASLEVKSLLSVGAIGAGYVGLRVLGRVLGGLLGVRWAGASPAEQRWLGAALLPQAGVALGMALVVSQRYPQLEQRVLSVIIASTVVFELLGPPLTRLSLERVARS